MPAREPDVVEFEEQRRSRVVDRMAELAEAGAGWINVSPGLDVDVPPPPRSPLAAIFGSRGPTVPLGTWTPAQGRDPASVGVHHSQGTRAIDLLAERNVAVPHGWRKLQDHPKRGLVLVVPPPAPGALPTADDLDTVLDWLLRATGALCPVRRTGEWRAYVHRP
jgi:hypothetical protein